MFEGFSNIQKAAKTDGFIRSMIMICDASSPVFPELFAV